MRLAQVILDIQTKALDRPYTYLVPDVQEEGDFPIALGCAVQVPFGNRQAIGFVVDVQDVPEEDEPADDTALVVLKQESLFGDELFGDPEDEDAESERLAGESGAPEAPAKLPAKFAKMKYITRALSTPYYTQVGAKCAEFMAHRYIAPLSACVRLFTPPGAVPKIVKKDGYWQVQSPAVGEVDDRWVVPGPELYTFEPRANAVKQIAILDTLKRGEIRVAELTAEYGSVSSVLKTLEGKGAVRIEHRRLMRTSGIPEADASFTPSKRPVLTASQQAAVDAIRGRMAQGGGTVLVDGVTGSGKTEVYLTAIEDALAAGKTAVVLVPEISLTPQTVARFRGRFGRIVAVLHSRMTPGERYDQWDFIRSGQARVVVGARSALFAPMDNIGLIIIDEEHEASYKQDQAPRYVSRDVAGWMCKEYGATLVLGSATPSLEALHAAKTDPTWTHVVLNERANGKPMPPITVIDRALAFRSGTRSAVFSPELTRAMQEELDKGHKCVLMLNQRGFAKFLLCRDCGFVPECESCSTSLTFHQVGPRGPHCTCHHCGVHYHVPPRCPSCGSPNLKMFGAGTQRVEDELHGMLAGFSGPAKDARVVRMDADTTQTKGGHQRLLEEFAAPGAAVLLGTQMIAKGLDFSDVTLVGVISADTMLALPDFRAAERTFDLIEQVAGRAGRAELPGRVFIQTYRAQEVPIVAAATYNRDFFTEDEFAKRQMLGYPPFVRLANVLAWGEDDPAVRKEAERLSGIIAGITKDQGSGWYVSSASPCVLGKLRGAYRWHVVVKAPLEADLSTVLEQTLRSYKAPEGVTVSIDVDAFDLL